jgi:hypothetical protein
VPWDGWDFPVGESPANPQLSEIKQLLVPESKLHRKLAPPLVQKSCSRKWLMDFGTRIRSRIDSPSECDGSSFDNVASASFEFPLCFGL